MVLMLLDHTRDYVHHGAWLYDPTDPAVTTVPVFFTRWITHYCAPVFVFLSGVSIYLQQSSGRSRIELSRFLLTRGLWLIVLEFTVVRLGITFNLDYSFAGLMQVIWVIGLSMVVMAALIWLPLRLVGAIGLAMVLFHNLLDGIRVPQEVAFGGGPPPDAWQVLWMVLHQPGVIPVAANSTAFLAYPLVPWVGVMALGYAAGRLYEWDAAKRRRLLLIVGISCIVLFAALRIVNFYGDPVPWSGQATAVQAFLSFLNTTKYPPSLLFLLMTLGPSLVLLAFADRLNGEALWQHVLIVFGRVPLFFYLLQFPLAHAMGVFLSWAAGKDTAYLFMNFPQSIQAAPPDHGFSLWVVYAAWAAGLVLLYPLCLLYGNFKRRNKHWLLSYL